ncbi:MAG: peroxide stress protein YaaA [Crocinitomicaceae bacterium]|nr:peroxide stress protein YaaA [Crocinitomicaceae bacterium]
MKIILSPAKSLNEDLELENAEYTQPIFLEESERLAKKLKKVSAKKLGTLMNISNDLAALNQQRYQDWSLPFTEENSLPAGFTFSGAAYQGMDFQSMDKASQERGQKNLRILSGLYGLLKPFDLIQPYRLEMGTRFQVTPKVKNLYLFWGEKLREELERELAEEESQFIVNVASAEYFKAAQLNKIKYPVITAVFKDRNAKGEYKVNMTFAKQARGRMTRFILENDIQKMEDLKGFDVVGYNFSSNESSEFEYVYLRDKR